MTMLNLIDILLWNWTRQVNFLRPSLNAQGLIFLAYPLDGGQKAQWPSRGKCGALGSKGMTWTDQKCCFVTVDLRNYWGVCTSWSALFIDNSKIDDLHLISVRPQGLCEYGGYREGLCFSDQQGIWSPGWELMIGSLLRRYSMHTLVVLFCFF